MADEADLAGDLAQMYLDEALHKRREAAADMEAARRDPHPEGDLACIECGEQIEPGRLEALPMTGYCAGCARLRERRSKLRASG